MTKENNNSESSQPTSGSPNPVKVILADSQPIYRVGIRKILAVEDDIRVLAQAEDLAQAIAAASKYSADVILMEAEISSSPVEAVTEIVRRCPTAKLVLLTSNSQEQATVEFMRLGVRGIISRTIAPELLIKCVHKVAQGETWLDNDGINWVLEAYRNQAALTAPRPRARLNEKELRIIACVTQGMRNKDIASEVGTTEQVVKNYLRKVYDKLGVSDRLELALYCLHHRLLENMQVSPATAEKTNGVRKGTQSARDEQPSPLPNANSAKA